jgi:hypothetical protein
MRLYVGRDSKFQIKGGEVFTGWAKKSVEANKQQD